MFVTHRSFLLFALMSVTQVGGILAEQASTASLNPFSDLARGKSRKKRSAEPKKEWTIVIYIQACNNLESFAHKNLKEMMRIGSNEHINILVELHKPGDKSWRYRIEKGNCVVDEVVPRAPGANIGDEVVDAMRWAARSYPSDKHALVFWNHGLGVMDPPWSVIEPCYMKTSFWRGTDVVKGPTLSRATTHKLATDRGILFDDQRRTYLNNVDLRRALKTIKEDVLGGKKIDVVGMDACLMGMLEIPYQFKEYADFFVASQEFEFAQGWSYGPLMARLAGGNISAKDFCHAVVETYNEYYQTKTSYFTQSSVDISKLDTLNTNVTGVAAALTACLKQDRVRMKRLIAQARCLCLSFSMSDYIDLHSFYHELYGVIDKAQRRVPNGHTDLTPPQVEPGLLNTLKEFLQKGKELIVNKVVTKNTTGKYLKRARGLSIYFPQKAIDESYIKTEFAKRSMWLPFLVNYLQ